MPSVQFTSHLRKVAPSEPVMVAGTTLRLALDAVFALHPRARPYVLDDQERLRKHVVIFVDGARVQAGDDLGRAVAAKSEIHVLQALSGG